MGKGRLEAFSDGVIAVILTIMVLERILIAHHGKESALARAVGKDLKGLISVVLYLVAIALTLVNVWLSCAIYVLVALMWFVPDTRVERGVHEG